MSSLIFLPPARLDLCWRDCPLNDSAGSTDARKSLMLDERALQTCNRFQQMHILRLNFEDSGGRYSSTHLPSKRVSRPIPVVTFSTEEFRGLSPRSKRVGYHIVGGLNISKSKIGRSVSDSVCMRPRSGARNYTRGLRSALHVCSHFELYRQIRCWNAGPLVGATQYPRSPFPLLAAVSVAEPREFQSFVRRYDSFVSRSSVPYEPYRSHRSHYLYSDP